MKNILLALLIVSFSVAAFAEENDSTNATPIDTLIYCKPSISIGLNYLFINDNFCNFLAEEILADNSNTDLKTSSSYKIGNYQPKYFYAVGIEIGAKKKEKFKCTMILRFQQLQ